MFWGKVVNRKRDTFCVQYIVPASITVFEIIKMYFYAMSYRKWRTVGTILIRFYTGRCCSSEPRIRHCL
jgi:hypothetical protein